MTIKKLLNFLILGLLLFQVNVTALNKAVIDITQMSLTELSEALEQKLITSEELVELYLDRINEYDKNYQSIISVNKNALLEAKKLDEERASGSVRTPLHGIPIVVKDNIDVKDLPTTGGAKALKDNYPKANAFVIQKLVDAGAIIIAKTNMSEFAFYASSSNSSYGRVKNAFNPEYSAYGSSGGSAVAIAASFAAAALGTDTNASVRAPASANNVVGLRPSLGLISRTGVLPYDTERDTVGPITKTVADAIAIMNIINAYDDKDKKSINEIRVSYQVSRKSFEGITLGVPIKFLTGSDSNNLPENKATYAEVESLMKAALAKMEANGAKIVYIDEYYTTDTDGWYNVSVSGATFCDGFNEYILGTTGKIRNFSALANASGKITGLSGYEARCNGGYSLESKIAPKNKYRDYVQKIMTDNNLDLIVYPASKNKLLKNNSSAKFLNLSSHASSTINYPAMVVPLGFDKDNLPYGIEFMAPTNNEQLLFDVAAVYESLNGNRNIPEIAPSLYEISDEVQKLVNNYRKTVSKKKCTSAETKWLKSAETYFRAYSENEDVETEAINLNAKYNTNKFINIPLKGASWLFKIFISSLKWLLIIVASLVILLLIRKAIRRKIRKIKRKKRIRK